MVAASQVQARGIQDLGWCGELGLANALRPTAVEKDEQQLDKDVINITGNKDAERTEVCTHGSDPGVVQERRDVVPPPQESMDKGPSFFDYRLDDPYNDLIDHFDPYLEYSKGYRNEIAFEDTFYG